MRKTGLVLFLFCVVFSRSAFGQSGDHADPPPGDLPAQTNSTPVTLVPLTETKAESPAAAEAEGRVPGEAGSSTVVPTPAATTSSTRQSERDSVFGFYFRLGGLFILPTGRSKEVELANVSPMARLSGLTDGPIAGSWASMGSNLMAAATIGWAPPILNRQLSIETILALPFAQKMYMGGTLANASLAPTALGVLPTGVPALGSELGEVTVLPPVVTLVYRFFPASRVRPYLGAGASLLVVMGAKITNPALSEISAPRVEIPPKLGWVVQAGAEVRVFGSFFVTGDIKYIGGLALTAKVTDIWVRLPSLPLYGPVKVGDNVVKVSVDPVVVQIGIGMNL